MDHSSTIALVRRARLGDSSAVAELCSRTKARLEATLRCLVGRDLQAGSGLDSLVQTVVIDVMKGISKLRQEETFYGWVSTIVRHKLAKRRDKKRSDKSASIDLLLEPAAGGSSIESRLMKEEAGMKVLDAMLVLFPTYPEPLAVVYFQYFEGNSIQQLMARFEMSERTVQRRLEEGLKLLRSKLQLN